MSVSYSAITNYGKYTMGSVDAWGTNMNILRDPPKSIMTRRIDKVGQTSEITEAVDQSQDRNAECIRVFARGVNPSVSVSYQNNKGTSASLPYKVSADAFRPPVATQYDLQPLSRLPRIWTSAFTQPGFTDFSKKMSSCGNADVKAAIQTNIHKISYRTPESVSTDRTTQNVVVPHKYSDIEPLHFEAFTNTSASGISNGVLVDDFIVLDSNTRDALHAECSTNNIGYNKNEYIHGDIELDRVQPNATAITNLKQNQHKIIEHEYMKEQERNRPVAIAFANAGGNAGDTSKSSREARLLQKISYGGFDGKAQMPRTERIREMQQPFETEKAKIGRKISEQFHGRFTH